MEGRYGYSPEDLYEVLSWSVIGQKDYLRKLSVIFWLHAQRINAQENGLKGFKQPKHNLLVVGPTGSGKTLGVTVLAELLGLPVLITDGSVLTGAGWRGKDCDEIIKDLFKISGENKSSCENGVIIIDEIDKAILGNDYHDRSFSPENTLLKMIEGDNIKISDDVEINTSNILFIAAGAFEGIETIVEKRIAPKTMGFLGNVEKIDLKSNEIYQNITKADLENYGMGPQFLARFSDVAVLNKLEEKDLARILMRSKESVIRKTSQTLRYASGLQVSIDEAGAKAVAKKAIQDDLGARGLNQIIIPRINEELFDLSPEVKELRISANGDVLKIQKIKGKRVIPTPEVQRIVLSIPNKKRSSVENFCWKILSPYLEKNTIPFRKLMAMHNLFCALVFSQGILFSNFERSIEGLLKLVDFEEPDNKSGSSIIGRSIERENCSEAKAFYSKYKSYDPNYQTVGLLKEAIKQCDENVVIIRENKKEYLKKKKLRKQWSQHKNGRKN